ncbi:MAG: hypothetical protein R2726_06850 [Acidimicrobiales bacterium]
MADDSPSPRLCGTVNDCGWRFEPAELLVEPDGMLQVVVGHDEHVVTALDAQPIEQFDYRSPARFVPVPGGVVFARASVGRWWLLRRADGLAFRPLDVEAAASALAASGAALGASVTRRQRWPGKASDACLGRTVVSAVVLLTLLVSPSWSFAPCWTSTSAPPPCSPGSWRRCSRSAR